MIRNFQISYLRLTHLTCSECQVSYPWDRVFLFEKFHFKFSRNEGIDTCFNVECVLLGRNFDFVQWLVGGYCSLSNGYCSLPGGYRWLLLVTGGYCSLPLVTALSHFQYERKQPPEMLYKKAFLQNFTKFTRKNLCWSLLLITSQASNFFEKRFQNRSFHVSTAKFLRTPILKNICE